MSRCAFVVPLLLAAVAAGPVAAQDLDRDGLSDRLEQALLDRFAPTLLLSAGECDGRPAMMTPGRAEPAVAARDGTLYGHAAIRHARPGEPVEIELKYFHLWGRDCGRPGHALDVEHVSALIEASSVDAPLDAWVARFWYAAAHEGTVCDASRGAAAAGLGATTRGPHVFVSRGKHASYLQRGQCRWGCGSDRCDPGEPPLPARVVNVGEAHAPLNGAVWINAGRRPLAAKLASDFDPRLRAKLERAPLARVLAPAPALHAVQAPILGGDTGLDALVAAAEAGLAALHASAGAVGTVATAGAGAVGSTGVAVGTALGKTASSVARFLRLK